MTAPAIIAGSLVDMKNVACHKCLRLVIDVPAERALEVIKTLGWATAVNPIPVAVARLETPKEVMPNSQGINNSRDTSPNNTPPVPPADKAPGRAPKAWNDLPLSQQAGIRCAEPAFWRFLEPYYGMISIHDAVHAAECVRLICGGIATRADLKRGTIPGSQWQRLDAAYQTWQREAEIVPA